MLTRHPSIEIPERLWRLVHLARRRLLILDYDGTLAPFHVSRLEARPSQRTLDLLAHIEDSTHTDVAIVTGRPVHEVAALLPLRGALVGEHGWEYRSPDGTTVQRPLDRAARTALHEAEEAARRLGIESLLERKRTSLVLHTRSLPAAEARATEDRCETAWRHLSDLSRVRIDRIDRGVEIRALGRDKGTAVLSLMSQSVPGTLGVYLGDEFTDEDAFASIRDWGFGIRVGAENRPTIAMGRIRDCEAVNLFLERWISLCEAQNSAAS